MRLAFLSLGLLALTACAEPVVPPVEEVIINLEAKTMTIDSECPMAQMTYKACTSNMIQAYPNYSVEKIHDNCEIVANDSVETYGCD